MTIKVRITGAFAIVLALLLALGVNSLLAIVEVQREAQKVEKGLAYAKETTDYTAQIRTMLGRAALYVVSENTYDLERLKTTVQWLEAAAPKLDGRLLAATDMTAEKLRTETKDYIAHLNTIIVLAGTRQKNESKASEALTNIQVLASAMAEHAGKDAEVSIETVRLLSGATASGISTFRYRTSRDPADSAAAKRWLEIAKSSLQALLANPTSDQRIQRLAAALAAQMRTYEEALLAMVSSTEAISQETPSWKASGEQLLADGVFSRRAAGEMQHEAVTRMLESISGARVFNLAATVLALASGLFLALALVRDIVHPLVMITEAMRKLAAGRLETHVPLAERGDEVGAMAKAVAIFRDGLLRVRTLDSEKEEERLTKQVRIQRLEALNSSFQAEAGAYTYSLSEAAEKMTEAAKALLEIAAQTNSRSANVAAAAEQATAHVRLVAATTEEVSTAVNEIDRQVYISTEMARNAVTRAQEADVNVRALLGGAQKIGDVVGLIQSITQKINLLALNATIEAARAGEAGRGFAVVASEVKQLALATAHATEDIGRRISNIQDAMQAAANTIEEIRLAISGMNDNTANIAQAVQEQSMAIRLITSSAAKAAAGADEVTFNIADVQHASGSTGAAARQVLGAAETMATRAEAMNKKVGDFLKQVRSV